jgi:hypothetical protein
MTTGLFEIQIENDCICAPAVLILRSRESGVSKDGSVRVAILRDAMLRMAPQDEDGVCGECSGSVSPNVLVKSAICSGVRKRGLSPRSSR